MPRKKLKAKVKHSLLNQNPARNSFLRWTQRQTMEVSPMDETNSSDKYLSPWSKEQDEEMRNTNPEDWSGYDSLTGLKIEKGYDSLTGLNFDKGGFVYNTDTTKQ
tara:strand:+ start:984 stop:1298 length:315 start_codon:yes stop_codon:yes gene_type:complete